MLNRNKIFYFTPKSLKRLYLLMISSKNLLRSVSCRVQIKCFHMSSLGPMEFQTNETAAMLLFQTKFSRRWTTIYLRSIDALYTHAVMFMTSFIQYTAISRKVVGKSAPDNPERHCGWFWVHCSSETFERIGTKGYENVFASANGK